MIFKTNLAHLVKRRQQSSENGFSLVEVIVGFALIIVIVTASSIAVLESLGTQQNNERYSRGVQLARDYIERTSASHWNSLGFSGHEAGFRDKWEGMDTVVVGEGKPTTGILPIETRFVGGVEYTIQTDIVTTDIADNYAARYIHVQVSYDDEKNKNKNIKVKSLRAPTPSEQIPPAADLTDHPGLRGEPAMPNFYDEINKWAGSTSAVLGTELTVKVLNPGLYPVTDIRYSMTCANGVVYNFSYENTPPGIMKSKTANTWTVRYMSTPSGFPCELVSAGTITDIRAENNAGISAPLTVKRQNFKNL